MSEERTENQGVPESPVQDPMERIKAIRSNISQAQDEKALLERKAGDVLGASGNPELVNEEIAAKVRFVRDSYEELGRIQDEINQQAEIEKLQAETSQDEQGDETNEPA